MMTGISNKKHELQKELSALQELGYSWFSKHPIVSTEFEGCEGKPVSVMPGHVWAYIFYTMDMFREAHYTQRQEITLWFLSHMDQ